MSNGNQKYKFLIKYYENNEVVKDELLAEGFKMQGRTVTFFNLDDNGQEVIQRVYGQFTMLDVVNT